MAHRKIRGSLVVGLLVAVTGLGLDVVVVPSPRPLIVSFAVANLVAGLVTALVCLAIQLTHEEEHYRFAAERSAMITELNHNVRNAVFSLCVAVERLGDAEAQRLSHEAMQRINIALRDATVDAVSGKHASVKAKTTAAA